MEFLHFLILSLIGASGIICGVFLSSIAREEIDELEHTLKYVYLLSVLSLCIFSIIAGVSHPLYLIGLGVLFIVYCVLQLLKKNVIANYFLLGSLMFYVSSHIYALVFLFIVCIISATLHLYKNKKLLMNRLIFSLLTFIITSIIFKIIYEGVV